MTKSDISNNEKVGGTEENLIFLLLAANVL